MANSAQKGKQVYKGTWQKPEQYATTDDYVVLGGMDSELSLASQARLAREQLPDIFDQLGQGDF